MWHHLPVAPTWWDTAATSRGTQARAAGPQSPLHWQWHGHVTSPSELSHVRHTWGGCEDVLQAACEGLSRHPLWPSRCPLLLLCKLHVGLALGPGPLQGPSNLTPKSLAQDRGPEALGLTLSRGPSSCPAPARLPCSLTVCAARPPCPLVAGPMGSLDSCVAP